MSNVIAGRSYSIPDQLSHRETQGIYYSGIYKEFTTTPRLGRGAGSTASKPLQVLTNAGDATQRGNAEVSSINFTGFSFLKTFSDKNKACAIFGYSVTLTIPTRLHSIWIHTSCCARVWEITADWETMRTLPKTSTITSHPTCKVLALFFDNVSLCISL